MKNDIDILNQIFKKQYNWILYLTLVVSVLEVLFAIRLIFSFDKSIWEHHIYLTLYSFLFLVSLITSIILLLNRKNKNNSNFFYKLITYFYCTSIILWSIGISFIDCIKMNTPIVFLTILTGVASISLMKPKVYFVVALLSTLLLIGSVILYSEYIKKVEFSSGTIINIVIFVLTTSFIAFKTYNYAIGEQKNIDKFLELAKTDQLTSLGNRGYLDHRLNKEFERNQNYVFGIVDIDNFKEINDLYGHDVGDKVIIEVSSILKEHFREDAYRYGGDEFVVVSKLDCDHIFKILKNIQNQISQIIDNKKITISFGLYNNNKLKTPIEVFRYADKALYEAKIKGKNCGIVYNDN